MKGLMRFKSVRWFVDHSLSERRCWQQFINNEMVAGYRPLVEWTVGFGMIEFERDHYGIGLLYYRRFGTWSRIRHKFVQLGRWTFFLNLGKTAPYNPQTGMEHTILDSK